MSGTPNKRPHEDSGGHSSLSRYTHTQDDSGTFSKVPNPPTAPNDYHPANFETGQDSRMPKVPRTEIREIDNRRSPLIPIYRTSSSINESQSDHVVNNEGNNNMRDPKVENRDVKTESKSDNKDVTRYTSKVDDHKDPKYERDVYSDKDAYNPVNWKESKDHHRTWKYPDGGNMHYNAHGQMEISRENVTNEEKKDFTEINENVSENKADVKNEERVKERDRKRKDGKNREFGEKDPTTKEERETDRKDSQKDKKEKDGLQAEKEETDVSSSRVLDQDNNNNNINNNNKVKDLEKESKDKKMEKDVENENERPDDGGIEVEGGFNHGVQQRKRMLRPAGSPQIANRDPRFRSRNQDNDGSTGKSDVSSVIYRVGECMQELIKLWKEYEPSETSKNGPTLEIRIPAEHVSATNRQVKGGQLWGTDIYTDDSDLVAVLMHTGFCRPTASPPPPAIQELRATVRVLPPQDCYVSTLRNNVRSRAWGAAIGCSFKVERCYIVKKGGGTIDLEPCLTHTSTVEPTLAPVVVERTMTTRAAASNALRQQRFVREVTLQYNLCNEPWIKYSISAIADKGLKKPLFTSARLKKGEVLYLESRIRRYELCFNGEKTVKAAHGNEMEANGVESDNNNSNNNNNMMDVFRWSECKKPLPQTVMGSIGIPLPPEHLQVLEEHLDWEDIQWSQTGVWISGKEYPLSRVHFLSPV